MNKSLSLSMPRIGDHAVCVRIWDWSESSQTAVLLTKDHGMIRVLAKGSKRERSAFSGGLELCTHGQMGAIVKPNSELALLTHWDLVSPMLGIRRSLVAYNAAMLGVDLIPRLIQDHDPHQGVFGALMQLLEHCDCPTESTDDSGSRIMGVLAWYLWTVLVEVGAMPVVDCNVLTGEALKPAKVYGFSAQLGGITDDPITAAGSNQGSGAFRSKSSDIQELPNGVWRIRAQTVELMRSLGQSPDIEAFQGQSPDQNTRLARLLGAYIRERTGTEIPAMRWLIDP